jgi:hypothetical protein
VMHRRSLVVACSLFMQSTGFIDIGHGVYSRVGWLMA